MPDQNDNRNGNKPDLPIAPKGNRAALVLFFSIIVLLAVFLFFVQNENSREISYSSFLSYLELG